MATKQKRRPVPKKERELAALRQRIEDIYSGVIRCDVKDEITEDTPTLCRSADEWESIISALKWTLGVQLKDKEHPNGFEWVHPFETWHLGKFGNPEMAAAHLYAFGIRA